MTSTQPEQRWRLQAWDHKGVVIHDDSYVGDAALDVAAKAVERRPDCRRYSVKPDASTGRPSITAPPGPPPPDPSLPPPICLDCDLTEAECRRFAATSGHTFTPMNRP